MNRYETKNESIGVKPHAKQINNFLVMPCWVNPSIAIHFTRSKISPVNSRSY